VTAQIRGSQLPIAAAVDINHWIEPSLVVSKDTSNIGPFGIGGGDCLFNKTTLFFFAGGQERCIQQLADAAVYLPRNAQSGFLWFRRAL
jgi:hypothetical protein